VIIHRLLAVLAVALVLAGCDDPSQPLTPPQVRSLSLYMVLDPDQPEQPLLVKAPQAADPVLSPRAEVLRDGTPLESIALEGSGEGDNPYPCTGRYGSLIHTGGPPRCLTFRFTPQHGATYRVAAGAQARPDASATTTVPGRFEIRAAVAEGDVPGTAGLRATWTRSEGAYRYVVALRSDSLASCVYDPTCSEGDWDTQAWWVATTDTTLETTVPRDRVRGGMGGWRVEVYAMDRAIFEYLSTGTSAEPFPVPPRQNVLGGYGAVGSWVRRSVPVGP
jgi:hypothetical protein